MDRIYRLLRNIGLIALLSLAIIGCSRINQSNFDKVKPEMTMKEVVSILGEPTSSDSVNIAGISGTSATWKDKEAQIDIQFLNDKVAVKTFNKVNPKNPN